MFFGVSFFKTSTFINKAPVSKLSPGETKISFITPVSSAGISMDALSDSNTNNVSSLETVSPTDTTTSLTSAPSIPSPKSGNSISLTIVLPYTLMGFGFSGSRWYLSITFSTTPISILFSFASALIAVRTI